MSIFSRGSEKRKDFVKNKMEEFNTAKEHNYTEPEATDEYMKQKKAWASYIIEGLKKSCKVLCDPKSVWTTYSTSLIGNSVFWKKRNSINSKINKIMNSEIYKNVKDGGSSSKYLQTVQYELGKVMSTNYNPYTDPVNLKSSMKSCGKGLSKLKHPIGSTALVKVGKKGERIVDYVDELARLMLNKSVQENAATLVQLDMGDPWPENDDDYTYTTVKPKYVEL